MRRRPARAIQADACAASISTHGPHGRFGAYTIEDMPAGDDARRDIS